MIDREPEPRDGPGSDDAAHDGASAAEAAPPRAPTTPTFRMLRAFAFDPLLSNQLDTLGINRVTLPVLWEEGLAPGPVGEYLEVVDCDPAGGCFYEPVDLNNPHLLATDGLAPSEGNPQFHQQMVYAVAMTTIDHFEKALGRKALWSPLPWDQSPSGKVEYVPRLRIYPHALREANAYYSPEKKALLFGYFPASESAPGRNLPGGMVFTCLSHDIIAHETTHALLDGMHHRYIEPSNRDTFAIHEAFADIVALFQHFTFPEVLRHQIARTHGDLELENLLGQLAQQFGEAVGNYGALRDALGSVEPRTGRWTPRAPDPLEIEKTTEPHARGAILVAAVFDAFVSIYKSRVADLIRIATGGSGVLPAGNLHPDLVNRLAAEAAKAAGHVLTMCIRALDYCPPVDVTFGEYLRALITADTDLIDDDDLHYRVAMTEAFRRRGLYPPGVRSLGVDSLVWERADEVLLLDGWFAPRNPRGRDLLQELNEWNLSANRERVFIQTCRLRAFLHQWFAQLRDQTGPQQLEELTGLALTESAPWSIGRSIDGLPKFEIHAARPARRVGPDGQLMPTFILEITQKRRGFYDRDRQEQADRGELPAGTAEDFTFRGGATILFDLDTAAPRYFVRKSILSESRLRRQREFLSSPAALSLHATYFQSKGDEPFAFIHRGC
jgi:hypothetical protein